MPSDPLSPENSQLRKYGRPQKIVASAKLDKSDLAGQGSPDLVGACLVRHSQDSPDMRGPWGPDSFLRSEILARTC